GPLSQKAADIAVRNGIAYIVAGGVNDWNYSGEATGYSISYNGYWINFNQYNSGPPLDTVTDLFKAGINPLTGETYLCAYKGGLIYLDATGAYQTVYNKLNSTLDGAIGDLSRPRASGIGFDSEGNMWVSNYGAVNPLSVQTVDGTWKSFHPTSNTSGGQLADIVVDQSNYKWIVLARGNGILVYNSGADPLSTSVDQWKTLSTGVGSGGLPTKTIQCLAVDKDGYVWAGTDQGVAVFYCPYSVFDAGGCDAQQIIVKQDIYNGYLLGTESVNDIAVDGANRKWFATNNGAFQMSADGTTELFHFTTDNSPLFSNNINCIGIDNQSGDVYFGTDLGIIVYRGDANEGTDKGNLSDTAFIFPNPVRENFSGVVAIQHLAYQSQIKITDLAGVLVYETESNGGEAVWNVKDLKGNRVNTGVYLVYATNADATDKLVGKIAVIK
ncbi:MAG: two-component regulator propeller domain-containing protein, partial [Bacteroidota bacterium]